MAIDGKSDASPPFTWHPVVTFSHLCCQNPIFDRKISLECCAGDGALFTYMKLKKKGMKRCKNLPSIRDWDNSSSVLSNTLENRLREVKMLQRWIAPASIIVWECIVRRAKVGSRDNNGTRKASFWVIHTFDFKASSTAQSIVEQCGAQSSCVCPITLAI